MLHMSASSQSPSPPKDKRPRAFADSSNSGGLVSSSDLMPRSSFRVGSGGANAAKRFSDAQVVPIDEYGNPVGGVLAMASPSPPSAAQPRRSIFDVGTEEVSTTAAAASPASGVYSRPAAAGVQPTKFRDVMAAEELESSVPVLIRRAQQSSLPTPGADLPSAAGASPPRLGRRRSSSMLSTASSVGRLSSSTGFSGAGTASLARGLGKSKSRQPRDGAAATAGGGGGGGGGGGVSGAKRKIPMAWKEFMAYVIGFALIILSLTVPMSIFMGYVFFKGQLITMQTEMSINQVMYINSATGSIGINTPSPTAPIEITAAPGSSAATLGAATLRVSSIGTASSQVLEFGSYPTGSSFVRGVRFTHSLDANSGLSQLTVDGGDLFVDNDAVVSGTMALRGSIRIAQPDATAAIDPLTGTLQLNGSFLDLANENGAFVVRRSLTSGSLSNSSIPEKPLFSIDPSGSFAVQGTFSATAIVAQQSLYGSQFFITQAAPQVSQIANPTGDALFTIRSLAGSQALVQLESGTDQFNLGIDGQGTFALSYFNDSLLSFSTDSAQTTVTADSLLIENTASVVTTIQSTQATAKLSVAAGAGSPALIGFQVAGGLVREYTLQQTPNHSFVISRDEVPFMEFYPDESASIRAGSLLFTSTGPLTTTLSALQGSASLTVAASPNNTASMMFSSAGAGGNFSLNSYPDGSFTIENQGFTNPVLMTLQPNTVAFQADSFQVSSFQDFGTSIGSLAGPTRLVLQGSTFTAVDFVVNDGTTVVSANPAVPSTGFRFMHGPKGLFTLLFTSTSLLQVDAVASSAVVSVASLTLAGNLTVLGTTTFNDEVVIGNNVNGLQFGPLLPTSKLMQAGASMLRSTDNLLLDQDLYVRGNAYFDGEVALLSGDLYFGSSQKIIFGSANLYTTTASTIASFGALPSSLAVLQTDGSLNVASGLSVGGSASVGSNLTVTGSVTLTSASSQVVFQPTSASIYSPTANTLQTDNDVVIAGSLFVSQDMSVDGIIFAAVNVNPGFSATDVPSLAIPANSTIRGALGKDGKALITFPTNNGTAVGSVHCFDSACATVRTYAMSYPPVLAGGGVLLNTSQILSPYPVLAPDGLIRIALVDGQSRNVMVGACSDTSCQAFGVFVSAINNSATGLPVVGDSVQPLMTVRGTMMLAIYDGQQSSLQVLECSDASPSAPVLLAVTLVCASVDPTVTVIGNISSPDWSMQIMADGNPLILVVGNSGANGSSSLDVIHCNDSYRQPSCRSYSRQAIATAPMQASGSLVAKIVRPSVAMGRDGFPLLSYGISIVDTVGGSSTLPVLYSIHCMSMDCSMASVPISAAAAGGSGASLQLSTVGYSSIVRFGSDGYGAIGYIADGNMVAMAHCNDGSCLSAISNPVEVFVADLASSGPLEMLIGSDGFPLLIYSTMEGVVRIAHCANLFCIPYVRG